MRSPHRSYAKAGCWLIGQRFLTLWRHNVAKEGCMVIVVTYRFHPQYLWQPFRWKFEDGSDATGHLFGHLGCFYGGVVLAGTRPACNR